MGSQLTKISLLEISWVINVETPHIDTIVEIVNHVGAKHIVGRIVEDFIDQSVSYWHFVMETIEEVASNLGASAIDDSSKDLLIDSILFAFLKQISDDANVMFYGFGSPVDTLE